MKLFRSPRLAALAVVGAASAAAILASPTAADAPGYQLRLAGPSSLPANKPFVLTASGVDPADAGPVYLDVDAFDAQVVSACPAGYDEAYQLAARTNGAVMANSVTEQRDSAGNWSAQVGGNSGTPGTSLVCGYSHDTVGNTFARASLTITTTAGGSTTQGGTKKKKGCLKYKKTGKGKHAHKRCVKYRK